MNDKRNIYTVRITNDNENGIITGLLQEVQSVYTDNRQVEFNPLTALCDLQGMISSTINRFMDGYDKHPFFLGRKYSLEYSRERKEGDFLDMMVFEDDDTPSSTLRRSLEILENIISVNYFELSPMIKFSLSEFEIIKQSLKLKFSCEFGFKEKMLFLDRFYYPPITYSYETNLKTIFEENKEVPYRFFYTCYSMEDIIFSVFHYLILMNYKFNLCKHCSKYFATTTLKRKFCNRKSPYPKYEHLECEQAVRNIKQLLARRRKVIYDKLSIYYAYAVLEEFLFFCDRKKDDVDCAPNIYNLNDYEKFLSKDNIKAKFMKSEYLSENIGIEGEKALRDKFAYNKNNFPIYSEELP